MKKISLADWTQFSVRQTTRSYRSKDEKLMLKWVEAKEAAYVDSINYEYKMGRIAAELGVPTPKAIEMVETDNGGIGVVYENVKDKISFSRAISQDPDRLEYYVKGFTKVVKQFHATEADTKELPSVLDRIEDGLKATQIFSEKEKDYIRNEVAKLPSGTKCLHGDLQLSNAITSPSGDYIIDLGTMSYGNPIFDVGTMYDLAHYSPEELSLSIFHFDMKTLMKCWEIYAKEYFNTSSLKDAEAEVLPYARFSNMVILPIVPDAETVFNARNMILG